MVEMPVAQQNQIDRRKFPVLQRRLDIALGAEDERPEFKSDAPAETVTLIPMGAARLRISAFPAIGTGKNAREWAAPKSATSGKAGGLK